MRIIVAAALGALLVACSSTGAGPHPNLTGTWKYNEAQSENAREKLRDLRDGRMRGRGGDGEIRGGYGGRRGGWSGGMGGGGVMGPGGGGMRGGMRGGGRGRGDDGARRELMREIFEAPERLQISEQGDTIALRTDEEGERRLRANGKRERSEVAGGTMTTRARWKDARLVVETDVDEGPSTIQTYEVSADGRQLVEHVTLERGRTRISLRRTYDRE